MDPDRVNVHTLAVLIHGAETMSRRKYKCAKEMTALTNLMDRACPFWHPLNEDSTLSSGES